MEPVFRTVDIDLTFEVPIYALNCVGRNDIHIGATTTLRLNLTNAQRLRDAAAEIVRALSPLPDFGACAQAEAEAAPDPLQWRLAAKCSNKTWDLFFNGIRVAGYYTRGDGLFSAGPQGSSGLEFVTQVACIDEPAARRICEEIARGER